MNNLLELLTEANIRDWQRRVASGEAKTRTDGDPRYLEVDSFENQLFKEILRLYKAARAQKDLPERKRLLRRANNLRIQLMVGLEKDRPLLARALGAKLAQDLA